MTDRTPQGHNRDGRALSVWIVDPISYTGMAYTDVAQVTALQELGARPVLVGSDSWMLARGIIPRVVGFRGTHGRVPRAVKGARYLRGLAGVVWRAARSRPDIVHWQFTELPIVDVLAMVAIRLLRIPQALTAHELLPWSARPHHRRLFALVYRVVDAVVVHNEEQRMALVERFRVPESRIHVAPLGDYALFAAPELPQVVARARVGIADETPVALFFGTIRPSKGLEVLLHAWVTVSRAIPGAELVIVGKPFKGLDPAETIRLIDDLGIADSVTSRFEHVDPAVANDYYRAADVVVLPYHDIGTSGVLRYAYNSARPVIATAVGEHPSRIVVGETGYLVPPGDSGILAETLTEALRDRAGLERMGEAARAYADQRFRWIDSARILLGVYAELRRRP